MKLKSSNRNQGGALMVTLIACVIIGIVAASFLVLIADRYNLSMRSLSWNRAMPVLEAGVEEALAHLNGDGFNPTVNGWTAATVGGQPVYKKSRTLPAGDYYDVTLYNATATNPIIFSTGYALAPNGKDYISRVVKVNGARTKPFPGGISGTGLITLSGGATVDSYSSCLGPYSPSNSLGANATVSTDYQGTPAIKVGTAHIYGAVNTGPGGTVSVTGGAVGDAAWNATHSGIQAGASSDTMNVAFPTNPPPAAPFTPVPLPVNGTTYLASATYIGASFVSANNTQPLIVTGNAILYLTSSGQALTVSGSGYIQIKPGGSLKLYCNGNNNAVSGGGIVNATGLPANFSYYGLSGNTKLTYSGSAAFVGTVNAPQADFTISGSAGMFGSAIVKTYTGSGGSSFHYDECIGGSAYVVVAAWREL